MTKTSVRIRAKKKLRTNGEDFSSRLREEKSNGSSRLREEKSWPRWYMLYYGLFAFGENFWLHASAIALL